MLRHELESRGVQPVASHIPPAPHTGPQAQPPSLGHGSNNLFGGIMANQGGSGPGPVPPPSLDQQPAQHGLQPQPASVAPGAPQPPQSVFGGYPSGAAVNGMCE